MRILFVINSFYTKGNGLAASARRTVHALQAAGEEVRVLSRKNDDPDGPQPDYVLPPFELPGVFGRLVKEEGYAFSAFDNHEIRKALEWADVAHMEEPFPAQGRVCTIAAEMHVPCTCTYHIHPENLFASVGLEHSHICNDVMIRIWIKYVFDKCVMMQVPSENAAERLRAYHVKPEIRVISNGILPTLRPSENKERKAPPYVVICVGRYSKEKNPLLLLHAMQYCRHSNEIQLIYAGRGPLENQLREEGNKLLLKGTLSYQPVLQFMNYDELQRLSVNADLFVHCADIEVEGMSCMEMVRNGLVPVIAEGKYTACSQFALSRNSIYPCGNAEALASRIDYWLDNDMRRYHEAQKYLSFTEEYHIEKSIQALRQMFLDAANKDK